MRHVFAALWLLLLAAAAPAAAQHFPLLTGRVVDQAELLRPEQEVDLNSKLAALEAQSGRQMVVATVKSLEGQEIESYATALFRKWGIGDKQRDDGVLLLVAPAERKVRIENGYGADDYLTDAVSGLIIRQAILPRFKAGDMGGGIIAGTDAVIRQLQLPPEEAAKRARDTQSQVSAGRRGGGAGFVPVIFIVIIFFMLIGGISRAAGGKRYRGRRSGGIDPLVVLWGLEALSRSSRGRGGWGGGLGGGGWGRGGGGGGGFSGGGGWSGGGGASGSW